MTHSLEDSRAGAPSAASLGDKGAPVEGPPGRPATEGRRPPAGDGPAPSPEGSARSAAALPSARTRPARILRALAASPVPMSTPGLVDLLAEGLSPNQKALSWYGAILRARANIGHVSKAGRTRGAYQRGPAHTWSITEAGRAWLADRDAAPGRAAARKAEAAAG